MNSTLRRDLLEAAMLLDEQATKAVQARTSDVRFLVMLADRLRAHARNLPRNEAVPPGPLIP